MYAHMHDIEILLASRVHRNEHQLQLSAEFVNNTKNETSSHVKAPQLSVTCDTYIHVAPSRCLDVK